MDGIQTLTLRSVLIQANGIVRNEKGRIIARLTDDVDFDGEHIRGVAEDFEFIKDIAQVINKHSKEELGGNTQDFILAHYISNVIADYGDTIRRKEQLSAQVNKEANKDNK